MNIVKLQDIKLTHRKILHSYTLTVRKQKEKLRKQYHSPLQQKESLGFYTKSTVVIFPKYHGDSVSESLILQWHLHVSTKILY